MKAYVRIHSDITIAVTAGLQNLDVSNPDAHVPDRLKVSAEWPKLTVLIKKGEGLYPIEIKTWDTVKALAKDKIITIGDETDSDEGTDVADRKATLIANMKEVESKLKGKASKSLNDVANL